MPYYLHIYANIIKMQQQQQKPTHENSAHLLWGSCHHGEGRRKHGRAEGFHLKVPFFKKQPAF